MLFKNNSYFLSNFSDDLSHMGLNNNNISAKQEPDDRSPASSPLPSHQHYRVSPASSMHLDSDSVASQHPNSTSLAQHPHPAVERTSGSGSTRTSSPKDRSDHHHHRELSEELLGKIAANRRNQSNSPENHQNNPEPQAEDLSNKSSRGGSPLNSQQTVNPSQTSASNQNRYHPYCHSEIMIKSE